MRKIILIILIISIFLVFTACGNDDAAGSISTSFVPPIGSIFCVEELEDGEILTVVTGGAHVLYDNINDMSTRATDIIRGEILSERVEWINTVLPPQNEQEDIGVLPEPYYLIHTVYSIEVLEVFQGNMIVGDVIEVKQIGGQIERVNLIDDSMLAFESGDDLVLFLVSFDFVENMPSTLLSASQGVYHFSSERTEGADDPDSELESLNPDNTLTLTLGDLLDLQYENFGEISESFAELFEDGVLDAWRE